jgi:hypothetical protein
MPPITPATAPLSVIGHQAPPPTPLTWGPRQSGTRPSCTFQAILPVSPTAHVLRRLAPQRTHVVPVHALPWAPEVLDLTCA